MGEHLVKVIIDGKETIEWMSDKYHWSMPGFVPLKCTDKMAQDLLWEYAQRRRKIDAEFSDDLEQALILKGYVHGESQ